MLAALAGEMADVCDTIISGDDLTTYVLSNFKQLTVTNPAVCHKKIKISKLAVCC